MLCTQEDMHQNHTQESNVNEERRAHGVCMCVCVCGCMVICECAIVGNCMCVCVCETCTDDERHVNTTLILSLCVS